MDIECRNVYCHHDAIAYIRVYMADETGVLIDADWPYCPEHFDKHYAKYHRSGGNHTFFGTMEGFRYADV